MPHTALLRDTFSKEPSYAHFAAVFDKNRRQTNALFLSPVIAADAATILAESAKKPAGSRIGGAGLFTAKYPWPVDHQGNAMLLLAQLNLAELPPRPNYPTTGLLQFFIADDYGYGADFPPSDTYNGYCVRLLPESEIPQANLHFQPATTLGVIHGGFFTVAAQLYDQCPMGNDRDYDQLVEKELGITGFDYELSTFTRSITPQHSSIFGGGWAHFTQADPRSTDDDREVLLQLDSFETDSAVTLMWGDCGIGIFCISPKDLANLDFSNVLYTWDCG